MTNLPSSSSEVKSSPSFLTSNLYSSECIFSLLEISFSWIYHHVSLSAKLFLFYLWYCLMLIFNAFILFMILLLNHLIQNELIFNIFTNFTLFLSVCLKLFSKMCAIMNFYIKQFKNLLWYLFEFLFFLTCYVLKTTCSIPMKGFSQIFEVLFLSQFA